MIIAHGATDNGNPYDKIVIRGFATDTIYRDGFRYSGKAGAAFQQFANVASVEVLKGPGATLYGVSEPGGLVNIVTKQPLDEPYYAVNQQIGSLADYRTTIDATGPLNADKSLLYRMNMSYETMTRRSGRSSTTRIRKRSSGPRRQMNINPSTWVKVEGVYNNFTVPSFFPIDPVINGSFVTIPRNLNYGAYSPTNNQNIFGALTWSHKFDDDWSIIQQIAFNRVTSESNLRLGTNVNSPTSWPFAANSIVNGNFVPCCGYYPPVLDRYHAFNFGSYQSLSTNIDIIGHINTAGVEHTLLSRRLLQNHRLFPILYKQYDIADRHFQSGQPRHSLHASLGSRQWRGGGRGDVCSRQGGLYVQDQLKLPYDLFLTGSARYQYIRQGGGTFGNPSFDFNYNGLLALPSTAQTLQSVTPRFGLLWRPEKWISGWV